MTMVKKHVLVTKLGESFYIAVNQVDLNVDVVQVLDLFIAVILEIPFFYRTTDHTQLKTIRGVQRGIGQLKVDRVHKYHDKNNREKSNRL